MKDISIKEHKRWIELKEFYAVNGYIYYCANKLEIVNWDSRIVDYSTKPKSKTVSMALFRYYNTINNMWYPVNGYYKNIESVCIDIGQVEVEEIPNTREDLRIML